VHTALSVFEILDLITEKLADEELYNDTRRATARNSSQGSQSGQLGHSRRQVRAVETEVTSDGEEEASWMVRAAAVEPRGPGQAQGPQGATTKPPENHKPREAGKGGGKAHGGNASRSNSQASHDGERSQQLGKGKGGGSKGGDNEAKGCQQCGGPHMITNCPLVDCFSCPQRQWRNKGNKGAKGGRGWPRPAPQ